MSNQPYPTFQHLSRTRVDLHIIQKQLDSIEDALTMAHHALRRHGGTVQQLESIGDAIDDLIAIKQSFGLLNHYKPVRERESAVMI